MITTMTNSLQDLILAADVFKARLAAQTDLIGKSDFDFRLK